MGVSGGNQPQAFLLDLAVLVRNHVALRHGQ